MPAGGRDNGRLFAAEDALDLAAELLRQILAVETVGDVRGEKAYFRAAVVALAFELETVERLRLAQSEHRIGQLDFAAGAGGLAAEDIEQLGLQDVTAGERQVCRRIHGLRR